MSRANAISGRTAIAGIGTTDFARHLGRSEDDTALEAIRIGTLNAAIFLGKERDMGSVEEGKLADLVLLSADPLADIANAQEIEMVIKGGRIIDRDRLNLPVNR